MHGNEMLILSGILFAGFACQWLAWRVRLPSILFLLVTGITVGPVLDWLHPDEVFGDLLTSIVPLAVAVILYEGSMTLKFAEIRGHGNVVRNLVTIGVLTTWLAATVAAVWLLDWDLVLAALFGAIVTVSGPTVIMPLLQSIRPNQRLASVIRWEGILVDPIGAILAVLVFNFIVVTQTAATPMQLVTTFGLIVIAGLGLGAAAGQAFGIVLRNHWVPDYLRNYATLAVVLIVFSLAEFVESESGLLAVTVMGVWHANMRGLDLEDILDFKESLTLVLVAGLFIVLAARLEPGGMVELGLGAIGVLLFLQLVAGPARAFVSSIGSELSVRDRIFLGFLFPRGIVAAAVSSLFALRLEAMQFEGADLLVPMVFTIIIGTVVIQSLSGRPLAQLLKVSDPEPRGVLITGTNRVAMAFAKALHETGHRVMVASTSWKGISRARMAGIPVFYGSAVSDYAERHLDLIGLGNLLALSERPGDNELACVKYRFEFGRESVYTMPRREETEHEKHRISGNSAANILYGGQYTIDDLNSFLKEDHESRTTEITNEFGFDEYRRRNPDALILFYADKERTPELSRCSRGNRIFPSVGGSRRSYRPASKLSRIARQARQRLAHSQYRASLRRGEIRKTSRRFEEYRQSRPASRLPA